MNPPAKTFFPSPRFPGCPFVVHGYGYREPMPPGWVDRPAGTGDFLLMFFHTAARAGAAPGAASEATKRAGARLFVWQPGARHHYGHERTGYLHSWLHCHGPLPGTLLQENGLPCLEPLPAPSALFLDLLRALHQEFSEERPDPAIAANLFENWARATARRLHGAPGGRASAPVPAPLRETRDHIDRHYAEPLSLAGLARRSRLSPSHFSAEFRRHFGTPPIEYLIRRRLHHAAYLLQDVNLPVTEVARRVGYGDLFYFSKLFKRFHGVSPRLYRRTRGK